MPRFFVSPDEAPAYLSPRRALEYLRLGAVLLDIRESHETNYRAFDVPSAILLPYSVFRERQGEVPPLIAEAGCNHNHKCECNKRNPLSGGRRDEGCMPVPGSVLMFPAPDGGGVPMSEANAG
jgi:hypothetical protein